MVDGEDVYANLPNHSHEARLDQRLDLDITGHQRDVSSICHMPAQFHTMTRTMAYCTMVLVLVEERGWRVV